MPYACVSLYTSPGTDMLSLHLGKPRIDIILITLGLWSS